MIVVTHEMGFARNVNRVVFIINDGVIPGKYNVAGNSLKNAKNERLKRIFK